MRTVVLRISAPKKKGGAFPLVLLTSPDETSPLGVLSRTTIPATLEPEGSVDEPGGARLTAGGVQELFVSAGEESPAYRAIGDFLYRLIARGKLRAEWEKLRRQAAGAPLRTLLDIGPEGSLYALRALPWELMWNPRGDPLFLGAAGAVLRGEARALGEPNPLVHDDAVGYRFAPDDWPLRVLIVYGPDPTYEGGRETNRIGAREELRALETLFASKRFDVEYDVLEHPLPAEIIARARAVRPHVLHFIGHSESGGAATDQQLLIYTPRLPGGEGYAQWPLFDIRRDLQGVPLRFVFLNACHTSTPAPGNAAGGAAIPFASLADSFLNMGALGVLGMQEAVPGDLAKEFAERFYTEVIAGQPVDVAARAARVHMSGKRTNYAARREWAFPVLRTRVMPTLVLPKLPAAREPRLVQRFVARVPERRRVREHIWNRDPADGEMAGSPHVVVIAGREKLGKSHLAMWCSQMCERAGVRTLYLSFGKDGMFDLLEALRWIRDGQQPPRDGKPRRLADWPLPARAFRRFTWELNHRLRNVTVIPPLPEEPGADVEDEGLTLRADTRPSDTFIDDTLKGFRDALAQVVEKEPLVLVLDQIDRLQETTREDWLVRGLFVPVARGEVPGLRLVLVAARGGSQDQLRDFEASSTPPTRVDIGYFEKSEYARLARNLCLQWSPLMYDYVKETLPHLPGVLQQENEWDGRVLAAIDKICAVFAGVR